MNAFGSPRAVSGVRLASPSSWSRQGSNGGDDVFEFCIGVPIDEREEVVSLVAEGLIGVLPGLQFHLVAIVAAADEGLGGVPADPLVIRGEQLAERVERLVIGLGVHEPFGLEERGEPSVWVSPGPVADRSF